MEGPQPVMIESHEARISGEGIYQIEHKFLKKVKALLMVSRRNGQSSDEDELLDVNRITEQEENGGDQRRVLCGIPVLPGLKVFKKTKALFRKAKGKFGNRRAENEGDTRNSGVDAAVESSSEGDAHTNGISEEARRNLTSHVEEDNQAKSEGSRTAEITTISDHGSFHVNRSLQVVQERVKQEDRCEPMTETRETSVIEDVQNNILTPLKCVDEVLQNDRYKNPNYTVEARGASIESKDYKGSTTQKTTGQPIEPVSSGGSPSRRRILPTLFGECDEQRGPNVPLNSDNERSNGRRPRSVYSTARSIPYPTTPNRHMRIVLVLLNRMWQSSTKLMSGACKFFQVHFQKATRTMMNIVPFLGRAFRMRGLRSRSSGFGTWLLVDLKFALMRFIWRILLIGEAIGGWPFYWLLSGVIVGIIWVLSI